MNIIIVLGHQLLPTGAPSVEFQARVQQGVLLLSQDQRAVLIISGGITRRGFPSEAEVGRAMVPPWLRARVRLETSSKATCDHPLFVQELLRGNAIDSLTVVTSYDHALRARHIFARAWPGVVPVMKFRTVGSSTLVGQAREAILLLLAIIDRKNRVFISVFKKFRD